MPGHNNSYYAFKYILFTLAFSNEKDTQHSYIVDEVNEGMQNVSWTTAKEYITIKYASTWLAHKG